MQFDFELSNPIDNFRLLTSDMRKEKLTLCSAVMPTIALVVMLFTKEKYFGFTGVNIKYIYFLILIILFKNIFRILLELKTTKYSNK